MPHINHRRGETRRFVFRREHGHVTRDLPKGKRESHRWWQTWINRTHRRQDRYALVVNTEDPICNRRSVKTFMWLCY